MFVVCNFVIFYNFGSLVIANVICFNSLINKHWFDSIKYESVWKYFCVTGKRSELLSGNTVVLKEKIDDTNQIFANGKWSAVLSVLFSLACGDL